METITEFLNKLANKGVKLSAQAGELSCYAQKGALTNDLKDGITRFKPELIFLLEGREKRSEARRNGSSSRQSREFALSAGQQGLYILQKLHPQLSAYNVPLCFKINADINTGVMAKAWNHVLEQFPILTGRVVERDGALYQRLDGGCKTTIQQQVADFADDEELLSFLQKRVKQPFDLNRGPLNRIELFMRDKQKPILLITVHHIVFDGASAVIVLRSLLEFYQQLGEGKPVHLSHQLSGFQEFVEWEEAMLRSEEGAAHAKYWQRQLDGALPAVQLPPDVPPLASSSFEGKTLVEDLPEDLCRSVREFSKAHSLPPSVIFLAVFQLLLHRYTNQDDIIVGMPVMGRAAQQFAAEVGYFINMVPLRADCGERIKLMDFLRKVHGTMLDALYHSSYPFPLMLDGVKSRRSDKSPIFRVSYAYQNFVNPNDFISLLQQQTLQLENVAGIWQEGDFDLGLEIYQDQASLFSVHLKYNPDLYAPDTISSVFEHYSVLVKAVSQNPNLFTHEYPILTEREKQKLLIDFNDTRSKYPSHQCLHELFAEQVGRYPENIAVVCGDERLTYQQLYERSHDLALYLQSLGVGPDSLVGVCMARSLDMVVGLLGILQAGGAYVPLDPGYPDERLAYILRDSRTAFVLTEEQLQDRLILAMPADSRLIAADRQRAEIEERVVELKARKVSLQQQVRPHHLAYVVYTSGPMGQPIGVGVTHRSVANLMCSMRREPGITQNDTLMAVTTLSLDIAALELYLPLCVGAQLVVATHETVSNGALLLEKLQSCGATILQAMPGTWRLLLDAGWKCNPKLTMLCGGEALPPDLATRLLETGCPLWNMYGCIETTIWSSPSLVGPGNRLLSLGFPIDNTQIYILDSRGLPQPIGVPGELHIAGDGLARGYLNRPGWTQEKFIANPFMPGTRMYKTGDLAQWLDDGKIQYLGRLDTQINIQGFRVEMSEIEARLNQHSEIQDSAVIAQGRDAGKQLIAFYRAEDTTTDFIVQLPYDELRAHLSKTLPEYMVPAMFVSLQALPLSPNGKVDRRALAGIILKQQLAYWQEKLAGVPESVDLVTDYPRSSVQNAADATHAFALDAQLTGQLKRMAEHRGATLFMILLAAFKVLLYRYTGQNDICVGTLIANRQFGETEGSIGTLFNALALRSQVEGEDTLSALLSQVKATCLEAYKNQDVLFEKVADMLRPQRSLAIGPIFQIMVTLQNANVGALGGDFPHDVETAIRKCDLSAGFTEIPEGLAGSIEYSTALYRPQTIERMAAHFIALCRAITATPTARIRDLEYLGESEKHQLLIDYNDTRAEYPKDKCIHQLFAERVLINPDKTAAVFGEQELSYQELYEKSCDLALYLQSMGVKPDAVVGLCLERSLDMMVGIMGTVQAGGAYLPLEPADPDGKLAYILQDSQAAIVLTQETSKYKIGSLLTKHAKLIILDTQWSEISKSVAALKTKSTVLHQDITPRNLSYLMYTSGSSGKAKGVLVEHQALVNRIHWMQKRCPLDQSDVVLQKTPHSVDVSVWECFWPMMAGASVVFAAPEAYKDVDYLEGLINAAKVTTLHFVPSMLRVFLDNAKARCSSVRHIFCSGEALDRKSVDRYHIQFPNASLLNLYGPTEAAIDVTAYDCSQLNHPFVPIGAPIDNTQIYILDRYNRPQPIGVPGELHIAGDGLARGYLNRPQLTQEKFVANPFITGTRMYKTGDLARWLDDGNIQHLGRNRQAS